MATLSDGTKLVFQSLTGYGGEKGSWGPLPANQLEGVGIIEYPPGTRTWPITLPTMASDTYSLTLPVRCNNESTSFVASFELTNS